VSDPARVVLKDPALDGQLGRTLTAAYEGAADLGEVFGVARGLDGASGDEWWRAWSSLARRVQGTAEGALAAGRRASARAAFLRASEYHRQSYFFIRANLADERLLDAHAAHAATFAEAAALFDTPAERVRIPYEGTALNGWWFAPDDSGAPRPTLLLPCGYDSAAESDWGLMQVPAALARGYNALRFEGPGQGEALYRQRLPFRPDYEAVLTPVVDWTLARGDVRPDGVVLVGRSFAGYLAARGATAEPRLAALVCDPAQPDMGAKIPGGIAGRVAGPVVNAQARLRAARREFFGARAASHGLRTPAAYLRDLRRYTMIADAGRITCPTLAVEAEGDFAGGGGPALVAAVGGPATLIRLTAAEGAGGHCGGLGQQVWAQKVFDWLAGVVPTG